MTAKLPVTIKLDSEEVAHIIAAHAVAKLGVSSAGKSAHIHWFIALGAGDAHVEYVLVQVSDVTT